MADYKQGEPTPKPELLTRFINDVHVKARLRGEPHRHHRDCIHNLSPDEQIALHGRTRDWWRRMGLPEPIQITPSEWEQPND